MIFPTNNEEEMHPYGIKARFLHTNTSALMNYCHLTESWLELCFGQRHQITIIDLIEHLSFFTNDSYVIIQNSFTPHKNTQRFILDWCSTLFSSFQSYENKLSSILLCFQYYLLWYTCDRKEHHLLFVLRVMLSAGLLTKVNKTRILCATLCILVCHNSKKNAMSMWSSDYFAIGLSPFFLLV